MWKRVWFPWKIEQTCWEETSSTWRAKTILCQLKFNRSKGQLISERIQDFCPHYIGQKSWHFLFLFWEKWWLHQFILKINDLQLYDLWWINGNHWYFFRQNLIFWHFFAIRITVPGSIWVSKLISFDGLTPTNEV